VGTSGDKGVTGGGAGGTLAVGTTATSGAAGGLGGSADGGTSGTGSVEDDRQAAEALDGFAILKPCVESFTPSMDQNNSGDCCCEELSENENQHIIVQFGGELDVTYLVTLRVAGVAERYWHEGGAPDATTDVFYVAGRPSIHGPAPNEGLGPGQGACKVHPPETDGEFALPFAVPDEIRPDDGCYNGFNIFAFTVSDPVQSYYLNHTTDFDGVDRQPHSVYETDYTVTVPIQGQAQLDFYTIDGDHHQVTNNGTMSVPELETPQPYNGNFLELSVLGVTRAN